MEENTTIGKMIVMCMLFACCSYLFSCPTTFLPFPPNLLLLHLTSCHYCWRSPCSPHCLLLLLLLLLLLVLVLVLLLGALLVLAHADGTA
jgi:hypothetical protein